jgi:hypothetical protein
MRRAGFLQFNGTRYAADLVYLGVPKQDIVLGFILLSAGNE